MFLVSITFVNKATSKLNKNEQVNMSGVKY